MQTTTPASILVLDDNDPFRRLLVRLLKGAGYTVVETGDPNEAMRLLRGDARFDLLLADVQMPGLQPHGINVGDLALNKPRGPKVIYITGDPDQVPAGFVDKAKTPVLGKPIRADALLTAVKTALAARQG